MSMDVKGIDKVTKALLALSDKGARRVNRTAASNAFTPMNKEAKRLAKALPISKQGANLISKSIGKKTKQYFRSGTTVVVVGPRAGFADHGHDPLKTAHLVEFGTAPHAIKRKDGSVYMHPGAKAHPFMQPAYDNTKSQAESTYGAAVIKGIEREAARLAK